MDEFRGVIVMGDENVLILSVGAGRFMLCVYK